MSLEEAFARRHFHPPLSGMLTPLEKLPCQTPQHASCLSPKPRNLSIFQSPETLFYSRETLFLSTESLFCSTGSIPSVSVETFLLSGESFLLNGELQTLNGDSFWLKGEHGNVVG